MTDPKEYISSGILELYVSGKLSESEADEVRRMADKHPEVQAEIQAIEESLAALAPVFSRKPQRDLLAGIMDQIEEETPVIKLGDENSSSGFKFRWMAIAAAIALLISLVMNLFQFRQIQDANNQIASLDQRIEEMAVENDVFASQIQRSSTQIKILTSPHYKEVLMTGTVASPGSLATVYYSKSDKKVFLNTGNLSNTDQNKQFQLWAIIDGKPVDAGVFDPAEGLIELNPMEGEIAAFAVTLEKRGGSTTPSLDMMYVSGGLS